MLPILGVPALVVALSGKPPLRVARCDVWSPQTSVGWNGVPNSFGGGSALHVRFMNVGDQAIRKVVFKLGNGETVVDAGTFSPGVRIDQMLAIDPGDSRSCSVASVTFADGSQWSADAD